MSYPNYDKYNQYITCCKPIGTTGATGPAGPIGPIGPVGPQGVTGQIALKVKLVHKGQPEQMEILEARHLNIYLILQLVRQTLHLVIYD